MIDKEIGLVVQHNAKIHADDLRSNLSSFTGMV